MLQSQLSQFICSDGAPNNGMHPTAFSAAFTRQLGGLLQKAEYFEVVPPQALSFKSFDGRVIRLADSGVLLPDGWIEFPFGDGRGKKRQYRAGVELGETVAY
jgi:hypothetical protein